MHPHLAVLVTTNGGTLIARCRSLQGVAGTMSDSSLTAVQAGTAHGFFIIGKKSSRDR